MKLAHQPLRVKLVALVLLLLTFAIVLIGLASNLAISRYLTDKVDDDLDRAAKQLQETMPLLLSMAQAQEAPPLPSDFVVYVPKADRTGWGFVAPAGLPSSEMPWITEKPEQSEKELGVHKTINAKDIPHRWRVVTSAMPNGQVFLVAKSLSDVDGLRTRVFWITVYGGASVLLLAASLGTEMVRRSLRPLREMEQTAGAIAGGDLTRRVPDPEEGEPEAQTELGSLARSLNSMLSQIEAAFTAQAASEASARHAEIVARDAADAATVSEARARRSEGKMRRFVADASHELRTPLTTIRGFAELYRQGAVRTAQETAALVKRIEDEARRMGLLVEDLLLLARMDQERPLQPLPVELRVLAIEAVQAARVLAPDREITLNIRPDSGDLVVRGDDARLRQVITNLMGNALAHTPPGSPVELRLSRDADHAVLEVTDHGPGLDPEQSERVFERFYRADPARTRRADGQVSTGLGLAIVAALVAAHEGDVSVESHAGEGATFRVRLPLDPEAAETA
jgi:two-component system, OmpR family, sensor kinase